MVHPITGQSIVLLSDYHDDCGASGIQRRSILGAARSYGAYVIVEDNGYRCVYAGYDGVYASPTCLQPVLEALVADPINFDANEVIVAAGSCVNHEIDEDATPLLLLTHLAFEKGIKVRTVECRQAEKISFQGGPISAYQVCRAYQKCVSRIQRYDDGPVYNAYYTQQLKTYREYYTLCKEFFSYLEGQQCNLRDAFACPAYVECVWNVYKKIEYDNYVRDFMLQGAGYEQARALAAQTPVYLEDDQNLYKAFFMYLYNFLIDTSIIHEIAQASAEPVIFVYCGSMHVQRVLPVLQAAGYNLEEVCDTKKDFHRIAALNLDWYFSNIEHKLLASREVWAQKDDRASFLMSPFRIPYPSDMLAVAYFGNNPGLSVYGVSLMLF
jgi:hypothetical protein